MGYNSGVASNVVKTALDEVFFTEFDYSQGPGFADATTEAIFKQDSTDRQAVITEQLEGVGYWEERAELAPLAQSNPQVNNQKTFTVVNFARELEISKNMFDDDLHSTVSRLVKDFARTGRLTRDRSAFNVYNNGFGTTLTNDGAALFSNTHTTLNGDTVDNLETAALSETSLNTLMVGLRQQLTQDGTLGSHQPKALLVPTPLFKTAQEITKSELRSGSADNDLNYYSQVYPGLMVYTSPFLDAAQGGSDTAWFLLSDNHSMYRWVRQGLETEMVDYKYQRNNVYIYKAEYREVVGPITWEGMIGSNGTT
jgi:hypothetical protein